MAQINRLSNREREVVKHLMDGKSNKLIAASLGISRRTVEFHLKNIYAKFQVSSRIELILKLGNATGKVEIEKLVYSTVGIPGERTENRDRPNPRMDWAVSFRDTVFMIGKEVEMKNLLGTRHVLVGVISALFAGLLWVAMLRRFGHASLDSIKPWILPLVVIMTIIGLSVGLVGKRNGNTPLKVFFSTLFGTGLSSFAMIPLTVIVVLPLGKLAEALGLVNRATMPDDVATTLVYTAMIIIWLIVGTAISTLFLRVAIRKSEQKIPQMPSPDHGLQKSSVIYVRAHG